MHPRPDQRHIRRDDVYRLRPILKCEFNIEGYPDSEFMDLVLAVRPTQVTLVPDAPDAITSSAGWDVQTHAEELTAIVERFQGCRSAHLHLCRPGYRRHTGRSPHGADRVELYTKPYADNYGTDPDLAVAPYIAAPMPHAGSGSA